MIKNKYPVLFGALSLILLSAGCTQHKSRLARDYGNSYSLAIENQTLDPEAEKNPDPVYGYDGQAAQRTISRYRKSFEKAAPPPIYTNVITSGSAGGK